ncbi:hypothetical protein LHK_02577 [Laribacter hongkongensis HLHK9]|uniref:Uncharacterized protein n=1 Tax=Laribacter hongkongensis (strain HLHK9) TaxID=557598 RepID=C1DC05_LARHH|nr:hypothetical protein LHK_02577 [Laribacter hongkongensis HLHK9]
MSATQCGSSDTGPRATSLRSLGVVPALSSDAEFAGKYLLLAPWMPYYDLQLTKTIFLMLSRVSGLVPVIGDPAIRYDTASRL